MTNASCSTACLLAVSAFMHAFCHNCKHCFCLVKTVLDVQDTHAEKSPNPCYLDPELSLHWQHSQQHVQTAGYRLPVQVLVSEKAAAKAGLSNSPAAALAAARKAFRELLPQLDAPSAEPSLAAARAVATALKAVQKALAGEAVLASLSLSLQEAAGKVSCVLSGITSLIMSEAIMCL